jgi:hypothetical protein
MPACAIEWVISKPIRHCRFKLCVDRLQFVLTEQLPKNQESEGLKVIDLLFREHYVTPSVPRLRNSHTLACLGIGLLCHPEIHTIKKYK